MEILYFCLGMLALGGMIGALNLALEWEGCEGIRG